MAETYTERKQFELVQLDGNQQKAWSDCKALLQWHQPAFTHLLYKMMNPDGHGDTLWFTRDVPTLATDGARILANPDFFFNLPLKQKMFLVCHEIGHAMFHHLKWAWMHLSQNTPVIWQGKALPYVFVQLPKMGPDGKPLLNKDGSPQTITVALANIAQDFVINAMLVESKIGEMPPTGCYDPNIATGDSPWQEAYHKLFKQCKGGGNGGGEGDPGSEDNPMQGLGVKGNPLDDHMAPGTSEGKDPHDISAQPNEALWKEAIQGALAIAQGKMPDSLKKILEALVAPVVTWSDHIQGLMARKVGRGGYDFRRADRRLIVRDIYAPGRSGHGCGTIVVGIDTSGSIYAVPQLIERFFGETGGMLDELRPRRIFVVWCDAEVHRVDELQDMGDLMISYHKGAEGGGGTSFVPVFEWIEQEGLEDLDAIVYLTDGDGTFPSEAPKCPMIWGDISHTPSKYPFGDVVDIPSDGSA